MAPPFAGEINQMGWKKWENIQYFPCFTFFHIQGRKGGRTEYTVRNLAKSPLKDFRTV